MSNEDITDTGFGQRFRLAWMNSPYRDLLQAELAKRYDYSQQTISTLMNGKRYPHLSVGLRICQDFNVTVDWLYLGREPMRPVLDPSPFTTLAHRLMSLTPDQLRIIDLLAGKLLHQTISVQDLEDYLVLRKGLGLTALIAATESHAETIHPT